MASTNTEPENMANYERDVIFGEYTLVKVYEGLAEVGIHTDKAMDAINAMQNHGVLFREAAATKDET